MGMNSDTELVGVGNAEGDWNNKFLEAVGNGLPYLDHLSIHRYFRRGSSTGFTDLEYANLMLDLVSFEGVIRDTLAALDAVEPMRAKAPVVGTLKRKPIGLVIDEWGVWDTDAPLSDGFRQDGTLRDAIMAASCLNLFHRYAGRISMTNIAQVINCLQSLILTEGAKMTLTPTYYVYEMYREHQAAQSVRVEVSTANLISNGNQSRPSLNASASRKGNQLFITVVNQSPAEDAELSVYIRSARAASARATNLTGLSTRSQNTVSQPETVVPQSCKITLAEGGLRAYVPARSVQAIQVNLS